MIMKRKAIFKGYLVDHCMTSKTSCTSQFSTQIKVENEENYKQIKHFKQNLES